VRSKFELADIVAAFEAKLLQTTSLNVIQTKAFRNIKQCRTAVLGGHEEACDSCGVIRYSYNSCGDRHCPKCQASKQAFWIDDLVRSTLPVKHYHVIFTVPHELNRLCLHNDRWFYDSLFKAVWETLRTFGYTHFGAESGAICVLHTWGQNLTLHPHIHCIVPAAGYSLLGKWVEMGGDGNFLYPVKQLSQTFRGKLMESLKADLKKQGTFSGFYADYQKAWQKKWVVHCEPSLANADHVVKYLGQYTHRVAISNNRILKVDKEQVTFIAKDYRDGAQKKSVTLKGEEFLRRFAQHVLPYRFVKIRRYGIYNHTLKRRLELCFTPATKVKEVAKEAPKVKESNAERFTRLTGVDRCKCSVCKVGNMQIIRALPRIRSPTIAPYLVLDNSL
jgi:hypothetical protein